MCCGQSSHPGPAGHRAHRSPADFPRNPGAQWTGPNEPPGRWSRPAHLEGGARKGLGRDRRCGYTPSRDQNRLPWTQSSSQPCFLSPLCPPWHLGSWRTSTTSLHPCQPVGLKGQASRLLAFSPEPLAGPPPAPKQNGPLIFHLGREF